MIWGFIFEHLNYVTSDLLVFFIKPAEAPYSDPNSP